MNPATPRAPDDGHGLGEHHLDDRLPEATARVSCRGRPGRRRARRCRRPHRRAGSATGSRRHRHRPGRRGRRPGRARPPLRTARPTASSTPSAAATDCWSTVSASRRRRTAEPDRGCDECEQPEAAQGVGGPSTGSRRRRLLVTGRACLDAGGAGPSGLLREPLESCAAPPCGGPALSRPLARPGGYRCGLAGRWPAGQRRRPGLRLRRYIRRLASEELVRRTPVTASRSMTASSTVVLLTGLDDHVAVGGDHQRVSGVARTGLGHADDPDRVLDRAGAEQGAPVLDLALAGDPGGRHDERLGSLLAPGSRASSGKRRS